MVEEDKYCSDILVQSAAIEAALDSFNKELLENHFRTCVISDIKKEDNEAIDDFVYIMKKLMR